jgi:hypothetical protein
VAIIQKFSQIWQYSKYESREILSTLSYYKPKWWQNLSDFWIFFFHFFGLLHKEKIWRIKITQPF